MTELKRLRVEQDKVLSQAYNLLSEAGFELLVEDGTLLVWPKDATIENDLEEGFVIVPSEYSDEFEQRQEELI
jgi:hypothetical protein